MPGPIDILMSHVSVRFAKTKTTIFYINLNMNSDRKQMHFKRVSSICSSRRFGNKTDLYLFPD